MIIVCDSCGTRFHLAEGRVGPKGAKVRCSNCHHSFQVTPAPRSADARENSSRPAPAGGRRDAGASARKATGDPDLDNPEFLFDAGAEADTPTGGTTIPDGVPFSAERSSAAGDVTQLHEPRAEEDDATPAGKRAPTPLMGLDPEVSARQQELNRDPGSSAPPARHPEPAIAAGSDSPFDFDRRDDYESTPVPGREPSLTVAQSAPAPAAPAGTPEPEPEPDTIGNLTGEEFDEGISRWDASITAPPLRRKEPPAARRVEVLHEKRAVPQPRRSALPEARAPERAVEPEVPAEAKLPGEPFPSPLWLRVAVSVVGIALLASGLRASLRQTAAPGAGPLEVQALGWTADQVRAHLALDAAGDPTLEVEGSLRGPGGAVLPSVRVVLLDATGRTLGGVEAEVGSSGFLAALPEPPPTASSFRVEIGPPVEPPPVVIESTTAALPEPPPASPGPAAETTTPAAPGP
jgi:predicted Zn finger-like uncharacterized protein